MARSIKIKIKRQFHRETHEIPSVLTEDWVQTMLTEMVSRGYRNPRKRLEILLQQLEIGCRRQTAYILAGIKHDYFYEKLKQFPEFKAAVEVAEERAVGRNVAIINSAARENWYAAAWYLERTQPETYREKKTIDIQEIDSAIEEQLDRMNNAGDDAIQADDSDETAEIA